MTVTPREHGWDAAAAKLAGSMLHKTDNSTGRRDEHGTEHRAHPEPFRSEAEQPAALRRVARAGMRRLDLGLRRIRLHKIS